MKPSAKNSCHQIVIGLLLVATAKMSSNQQPKDHNSYPTTDPKNLRIPEQVIPLLAHIEAISAKTISGSQLIFLVHHQIGIPRILLTEFMSDIDSMNL